MHYAVGERSELERPLSGIRASQPAASQPASLHPYAHGALLLSGSGSGGECCLCPFVVRRSFYVPPLASLSPSCILYFYFPSFLCWVPPFLSLFPHFTHFAGFVGTVIHATATAAEERVSETVLSLQLSLAYVSNCSLSVRRASERVAGQELTAPADTCLVTHSLTHSLPLQYFLPSRRTSSFLSLLFLYPPPSPTYPHTPPPVCIIPSLPRLHALVCSIGDPDVHSLLYLNRDYSPPPSSCFAFAISWVLARNSLADGLYQRSEAC